MNYRHAICPYCGQRNENLYLEETDGLCECERCGLLTRFAKHADSSRWTYGLEMPGKNLREADSYTGENDQKKAV